MAKALPDGAYKDRALQALNNIQTKLYNLPAEYKEAGELGNSVATELIKRGVEPEQISKLFGDTSLLILLIISIKLMINLKH